MNEMIERAAFAAQRADSFDHSRSDYDPDFMDVYRDMARAVIEAIRTPTEAMVAAAATVDRYAEPGEEWQVMIDAVLSEKQEDVA